MTSPFAALFSLFAGCLHRHTTFPQSPRRGTPAADPHVTCLDCGAEFGYDWSAMRIGARLQRGAGNQTLAAPIGAGVEVERA